MNSWLLSTDQSNAAMNLWQLDLKTNKEKPIRDWPKVSSFDLVREHLVFSELGSTGKNRVYSLTVE